jgi:hypothetical protein
VVIVAVVIVAVVIVAVVPTDLWFDENFGSAQLGESATFHKMKGSVL